MKFNTTSFIVYTIAAYICMTLSIDMTQVNNKYTNIYIIYLKIILIFIIYILYFYRQ